MKYDPCAYCHYKFRCDDCKITDLTAKNAQYCIIIGEMEHKNKSYKAPHPDEIEPERAAYVAEMENYLKEIKRK